MNVDKLKLASALQQLTSRNEEIALQTFSSSSFHWRQCLNQVVPQLPSINVVGVGVIPIPITPQDISRIRQAETKKQDVKGKLLNKMDVKIDPSCCGSLSKALHYLGVSAMSKMVGFKVTDDVEVEVMINHLTICSSGGHFFSEHHTTINSQNPGTLGKLILQLPVKAAYKGGGLLIEKKVYDFSYKSEQYFYCLMFAFSSCTEWQPIKGGCMVTLDCDLVWCPKSVPTPFQTSPNILQVAKVFKEVKNSLNAWNSNDRRRNENEKVADFLIHAKEFCILPLNEDYYESSFGFTTLRGSDFQLAHLLQSIQFLDVHLAIVSQTFEKETSEYEDTGRSTKESSLANRSFEIVRWIYCNSSLPQMENYKLDLPNQLVGDDIKTVLRSSNPCKLETNHHPVLVIQPRQQSIRRCGLNDFDILLDYLESRMRTRVEDCEVARQECLSCLEQILEFCEENPLVVWDVKPASKAEVRTCRLLKICRILRAQAEGIKLIDLLAKEHTKEGLENKFYEGIRTELVASDLVDMLWFNQGWKLYSKPILGLITTSRLPDQLSSFCHIVICLIKYRCIRGAYSVAHQIFISLSSDLELVKTLNQSQIDSYINSMFAIEHSIVSTNQGSEIHEWVSPFFCHMNFNQQFKLLFDLDKNRNSRLKNYPSCIGLFQTMALVLFADLQSTSSSLAPEMIHQLANFFLLQQNDHEIRDFFLEYVLMTNLDFVVAVIEIASSSVSVKTALLKVLKIQLVLMEKSAFSQLLSVEEDSEITKKLLNAFLILVQLEQKLELSESDSILAGLDQMYHQMPANRLANIIMGLMPYRDSHPALSSRWGLAMFHHMGKSLINQEISAFENGPPFDALLKLLKYFADLPDHLTRLIDIVVNICRKDRTHSLFKKLISSEEILIMADSYPFARSAFISLFNERLQIVKESIEKEVALAWRIPDVSLPGHPVVEDFLRSPYQQMHYANFRSKEQALLFSSELPSLIGSDSGYSIRVEIFGEGCELTKVYSIRNIKEEMLLKEKDQIEEMLDVFAEHEQRMNHDESIDMDDVTVFSDMDHVSDMDDDSRDSDDTVELPVTKRKKPDIIELD